MNVKDSYIHVGPSGTNEKALIKDISISGTTMTVTRAKTSSTDSTKDESYTINVAAYNANGYLPLNGGTVTGLIRRDYSTASNTLPMIYAFAGDRDVNILRVGDKETTSGVANLSAACGFTLKYLGTGSGNDNKLQILADAQTGTLVVALSIQLDGTTTFNVAPKVGSNTVLTSANVSGGGSTWGSSITVNGTTLTIPSAPSASSYKWANLSVQSSAAFNTAPEFASVKLGNGTSAASTAGNNCTLQFDATNKCLKFVF